MSGYAPAPDWLLEARAMHGQPAGFGRRHDSASYRKHKRAMVDRAFGRPDARVTCRWCKKVLARSTVTVDHVVPLCAGGRSEPSNLVLSCSACNQRRDAEYQRGAAR